MAHPFLSRSRFVCSTDLLHSRVTLTCSMRMFIHHRCEAVVNHRYDRDATGSESVRSEESSSITPSLTRQASTRCDTCGQCSLTFDFATRHVCRFYLYLHHTSITISQSATRLNSSLEAQAHATQCEPHVSTGQRRELLLTTCARHHAS